MGSGKSKEYGQAQRVDQTECDTNAIRKIGERVRHEISQLDNKLIILKDNRASDRAEFEGLTDSFKNRQTILENNLSQGQTSIDEKCKDLNSNLQRIEGNVRHDNEKFTGTIRSLEHYYQNNKEELIAKLTEESKLRMHDRGEIFEVINKLFRESEIHHLKSVYDLEHKIMDVKSDTKDFAKCVSQMETATYKRISEFSSILEAISSNCQKKSEKTKNILNNLETKINVFAILLAILAAIILFMVFKP